MSDHPPDAAPVIKPPAMGEPYLLTPGPLTTSALTKQAMLCDWGSWDADFRAMTAALRQQLIQLAANGDEAFAETLDCVPVQGSGSFAVEAMLGSFLPAGSKTLVLSNGAYGKRAAETLGYLKRDFILLDKGDYLPPMPAEVAAMLAADPAISHVMAIHCETSSGILNPIAEIAAVVADAGCKLLIDSMSAFGGVPLALEQLPFEAIVSSANKCIEGVPGFSFVLAGKTALEACKGNSHSLALDLHAQWQVMNSTGQWRFTPPTHVVAAFMQALAQHAAEGGIAGRHARYVANRDKLVAAMRGLGFETLLDDAWQSPIIVTFFCPLDPAFDFAAFYDGLKQHGFIIYPGKLTVVDSFRIGCIGQLDGAVIDKLVEAVAAVLHQLGVQSAAPPPAALAERSKLAQNAGADH